MKIFDTLSAWQQQMNTVDRRHVSFGFVPTMGNLHAGHLSLVRQAKLNNDFVVVSIFVNPTQFNNLDDLKQYPRTLEADLALLRAEAVDYVLLPTIETIYPMDYRFQVHESKLSQQLEGAHRPGHFDGVLTVVMKLLQLVKPQHAYFGEKDWQQLQLVRDMVTAFFMDVEIVAGAIVRDEAGLALSSRNSRLSASGLEQARLFASLLQAASSPDQLKQQLSAAGITIDYVDDVDGRRLAAVTIDGVRLLDNVAL